MSEATAAAGRGSSTTTRAAAGMGAITAVSRALGLVRVLVVSAVLGVSFLGNAFQQANSVSNVLFELLAAGALSAVLVPAFVELLDREGHDRAEQVAGGVLGVALAGLGAVTVVGVVGAPWLAEVLTVAAPRRRAGRPARAGHLPAAVLRPADPAVRGGHDRHRGALRPAPLRGHRRRARSATRS